MYIFYYNYVITYIYYTYYIDNFLSMFYYKIVKLFNNFVNEYVKV